MLVSHAIQFLDFYYACEKYAEQFSKGSYPDISSIAISHLSYQIIVIWHLQALYKKPANTKQYLQADYFQLLLTGNKNQVSKKLIWIFFYFVLYWFYCFQEGIH